jgi:ribosome-associated protein
MAYPSLSNPEFRLTHPGPSMRGRGENDEFLAPSRSQQRREALDVLALAEKLATLSDAQLERLPIPEGLLPHILDTRRITAHVARKRQTAFLAKQMRREDDEALGAIRDALDAGGEAARRETARMHRAEQLRERLLSGGDDALGELLAEHPNADRQQLRQLVRNALDERAKDRPQRAFRELYRAVHALLGDGEQDGHDQPA